MSAQYPRTVHDFFGFAECLYEVEYAAENKPEACAKVAEALDAAEIPWEFDGQRGYDFGCWSPVALIFPAADVPLIQVSLHSSLEASVHVKLGQALGPLRDAGYLLVCTGGVTHNLMELSFGDDRRPPSAAAFDLWVSEVMKYEEKRRQYNNVDEAWAARSDRLCKWLDPDQGVFLAAQACHPTPEHYLPLLVASGSGGPSSVLHHSWHYGCLSMASFMFGHMPSADDPNLAKAVVREDLISDETPIEPFQGTEDGQKSSLDGKQMVSGLDDSVQMEDVDSSHILDDPAALRSESKVADSSFASISHDVSGLATTAARPRTASSRGSSRPPSREMVRMAVASGVANDEQQFVQQIRRVERGESFRTPVDENDKLEPPPSKEKKASEEGAAAPSAGANGAAVTEAK